MAVTARILPYFRILTEFEPWKPNFPLFQSGKFGCKMDFPAGKFGHFSKVAGLSYNCQASLDAFSMAGQIHLWYFTSTGDVRVQKVRFLSRAPKMSQSSNLGLQDPKFAPRSSKK